MPEITPSYVKEVHEKATLMLGSKQLSEILDDMATKMTEELKDKDPIVLCVMNGAVMVASELLLRLKFPLRFDYLHVTRYLGETSGGDNLYWKKEPEIDLEGQVIVVVDDILDKGITLRSICDYCELKGAKKIYSAILLDKKVERDPNGVKDADFVGIEIEDKFVYGFGLDYHDYLRNVKAIYHVAPEHM